MDFDPNIFFGSIASGGTQAILFNPIDRALFLKVHNKTNIFNKTIWKNPFQGFSNVAVYRIINNSSYFYFQNIFNNNIKQIDLSPSIHKIIVGLIAGTTNGMILNQFQIVKFQMWSEEKGNFLAVTKKMWQIRGIMGFFRGIRISIYRDATFGIAYESLRSTNHGFIYNMLAAMLGSIISSPFNYCRSRVYGTPPNLKPLNTYKLLTELGNEMKQYNSHTKKIIFLNNRLNIGLGTIRVGLGMTLGQYIVDSFTRNKI